MEEVTLVVDDETLVEGDLQDVKILVREHEAVNDYDETTNSISSEEFNERKLM